MKNKIVPLLIFFLAGLAAISTFNPIIQKLSSKIAFRTKEPLLITGEQHHYHYSILPTGTVLYFDRGWPEGHQTYHVYFEIKGEFQTEPTDPEMISPLWLRPVDPEEMPKLLNNYPVTKDELIQILKARKVSRSEILQLLREWQDE